MNSPADWLLVVEHEHGTKGYINLWKAIQEGRLIVKVNSLNRAHAVDVCADTPENRHDVDTAYGTKPLTRSAWMMRHQDYSPRWEYLIQRAGFHDHGIGTNAYFLNPEKLTRDDLWHLEETKWKKVEAEIRMFAFDAIGAASNEYWINAVDVPSSTNAAFLTVKKDA